MSYWVSLSEEDKAVSVPVHREGGTYCVSGEDTACLNVTYNYSGHFYRELDAGTGLRWLNGLLAGYTVTRLEAAVHRLGTVRDPDYWAATPGNAGHALNTLLGWARLHPGAVWEVS